jgi:hypothetical protein
MTALVLLTLSGFLVALLFGGSLASWRNVKVRWVLLALGALALQLLLYNPPIDSQPWAITYGPWLFVLAKAMMVAALLANVFATQVRGLQAAWLIAAIGVAMNLAVVAANGGYMPQSEDGRVTSRGATLLDGETLPRLHNVKPIDDSTQLVWLSDVLAQPNWIPRSNVISLGDLLLAGGLGLWVFQITLRVPRALVRRPLLADT